MSGFSSGFTAQNATPPSESAYNAVRMLQINHNLPDWIDLPPEKVKAVLKHVNEYIEPIPFSPPPATLGRVRQLPFYSDYYLLELTNLATAPAYSKYALCKPGDVNILDWTLDPIYEVNEKASINLTPENIIPYLKFFSEYVFTPDGQRKIIETLDDVPWLDTAPQHQKLAANRDIKPASITALYDDGSFRVEVTDIALYDLYKSVIFVSPTGAVDWLVQDKLLEDLEIYRDSMLV